MPEEVKPVDKFDKGIVLAKQLQSKATKYRYELGRTKMPDEMKASLQGCVEVIEDAARLAEKKLRHMKEVLRDD